MERCLESVNAQRISVFSSSFQTWVRFPRIHLQGAFTYNCHFKRVGKNAYKFAKTRIYLKSDVFAAPRPRRCFINTTVPIWVTANSSDRRRKRFRPDPLEEKHCGSDTKYSLWFLHSQSPET